MYGRGQTLSTPRKQNIKKSFILEENKENNDRIRNIQIFLKQEKEERKKQERNERLIKDKIIGDLRTLFEQEEDY